MRVAVYSTKPYDEQYLTQANVQSGEPHQFTFIDAKISPVTIRLAAGHDAVCCFVNDTIDNAILSLMADYGIKLVALRCAGFNNVDLSAAQQLGITVVRVPQYSPYAIAEHAVGLILDLNRNIHRAHNRVREGDFSINGLLGFDLHGKTVALIGTGRIGEIFATIMKGFGCRLIAYSPVQSEQCLALGVEYLELEALFQQADIITLHCPLTPETHHVINDAAIQQMKTGVMIINTSRGALIDTTAAIRGLKSGQIGYLGLDVYEEEGDLFFENLSGQVLQDDIFARLLTFPNVTITGHQAFFTQEAVTNISDTTIANLTAFETGQGELHRVSSDLIK